MGAFGEAITTLVKDAPTLLRSTEATVEKTAAGKIWSELIRNDVEPAIGKARQNYLNAGMRPEEAISRARNDVKNLAFGKQSNGIIALLQAAKQQGGDIAARHLADAHNIYWKEELPNWRSKAIKKGIDIRPSSAYTPPPEAEIAVKDLSRMVNLPLISIPHALQAPLNGLAVNGVRASMRAAWEYMRDPASARAFAARVGAMSQETAYEIMAAQKKTSTFQILLDPLRKVFSAERRAGIAYSAVMGKHAAIEAAETLYKSSGTDKASTMQLKLLGIEPSTVMHQGGRLGPEDIEKAAYRSADEIMGFRSLRETPMVWEKNAAWRIGATYKQYGYRTMRLHQRMLTQAYRSDGLLGVAKKAALYATIFPIAGEMIKAAEGVFTLQNPWDKQHTDANLMHSEYVDALAMAMGFNLIYGATRSATYQKMANFLIGPIYSTGSDLVQDVMRANPSKNASMIDDIEYRAKNVSKDVLRRGGLPGRILSKQIFAPDPKNPY